MRHDLHDIEVNADDIAEATAVLDFPAMPDLNGLESTQKSMVVKQLTDRYRKEVARIAYFCAVIRIIETRQHEDKWEQHVGYKSKPSPSVYMRRESPPYPQV